MESRSGLTAFGPGRNAVKTDAFAGVPFRLKEAGVDWVTATCNNLERRDNFNEYGYSLLAIEHGMGEKPKPWRMSGFEGLACKGVAVGHRDDTTLIRLSGPTAFAYWQRVIDLSTNCSRLDLQVTISGVDDPHALILAHHAEALEFVSTWAKPPTVDLRLSNRSSPTLYLNRRVSNRFGRIYDKGDESGLDHYQGCVRYEWQFNNDAGFSLSRSIARSGRRPIDLEPYVAGECARRGLSRTWAHTAGCLLTSPRSRSTDYRRLAWFRQQVAPAVRTMIERGMLPELLVALGLSEVVQEKPKRDYGP